MQDAHNSTTDGSDGSEQYSKHANNLKFHNNRDNDGYYLYPVLPV